MGVVQDVRETSWGASDIVPKFSTRGFTDAGEGLALGTVAAWAEGDVLDIGVGGGRTTGLLADDARSYVGIDISPEMLDLARDRFPGHDLRRGTPSTSMGCPTRRTTWSCSASTAWTRSTTVPAARRWPRWPG